MRIAAVFSATACSLLLSCGALSPHDSGSTGPGSHAVGITVTGPGSVSGGPASGCRAQCTVQVAAGASLTLTGTADPGAVFSGWSQGCSGTGDCNLTPGSDVQVTATFTAVPPPPPGKHVLTVSKSGSGAVRSSPAGLDCGPTCTAAFDAGASITLLPTADAGFRFLGWGGACSGPGACTLSLAADAAVFATFEASAPGECAGLAIPPVPAATRVQVAKKAADVCLRGYADGGGNLALTAEDDTSDPFAAHFAVQLFDPAAHALGTYAGVDMMLDEQATGFLASNAASRFARPYLHSIDSTGRQTHQTVVGGNGPATLMDDPTGGAVLATQTGDGSGIVVALEAYDAQSNLRWRHNFPQLQVYVAHATDRAGNTLVLVRLAGADTSVQGQWFDPSGTPAAVFPAFAANDPRVGTPLSLVPRIGSGFFLQSQTQAAPRQPASWLSQIDALARAFAAAPAWLRAHDFQKIHPARGGTAYAFIDAAGTPADCTQHIEVVATTGRSCGSAAFNAGASGACQTASIDVAYDGTVIQQLAPAAELHVGRSQTSCTWQWWTGLLG